MHSLALLFLPVLAPQVQFIKELHPSILWSPPPPYGTSSSQVAATAWLTKVINSASCLKRSCSFLSLPLLVVRIRNACWVFKKKKKETHVGIGGRSSSIVVAFFWSSWPPLQSVGTPAWPPSPSPVSSSTARAAQHYYRESKSASILKVNF